jgi:alkylhydroperoxidase/carboxymuconolactone decarboxylase family protein YurZ
MGAVRGRDQRACLVNPSQHDPPGLPSAILTEVSPVPNQQLDSIRLRNRFIEVHGYWAECWQGLLDVDPAFFAAQLELAARALTSQSLTPKVKQLILVALHSSIGNIEPKALRTYIRRAFACGASDGEIVEVFELVSLIGIHAATTALPMLLQFAESMAIPTPSSSDAAQVAPTEEIARNHARLKEDFIKDRHYWSPEWDDVIRADADFFEDYLNLCRVPWTAKHLDLKTKELVDIAIDASAGHLYIEGLRTHMRNAIDCGASYDEIMEVVQLASTIGMQTFTVGMSILLEEQRGTPAFSERGPHSGSEDVSVD